MERTRPLWKTAWISRGFVIDSLKHNFHPQQNYLKHKVHNSTCYGWMAAPVIHETKRHKTLLGGICCYAGIFFLESIFNDIKQCVFYFLPYHRCVWQRHTIKQSPKGFLPRRIFLGNSLHCNNMISGWSRSDDHYKYQNDNNLVGQLTISALLTILWKPVSRHKGAIVVLPAAVMFLV